MTDAATIDPEAPAPAAPSLPTPLGVVEKLLFGLVNAQIYGVANARVLAAAAEAASMAAGLARANGGRPVLLGAVEHQIVVDGRPLLGASLFARRLVVRIRERGAGGLELHAGITGADVAALFGLLAARGGPSTDVAMNEALAAQRVLSIRALPPYVQGTDLVGGGGGAGEGEGVAAHGDLVSIHQGVVDVLQSATICACQGRDLDLHDVACTVEALVDGVGRDAGGLYRLAHYPEHDFFTFGHSIRVGLLAIDVARTMTDDRALLLRVGTAGLLHDVGKALIPWDVLHKRGKLDADERREMQRHPALGAGILLATKTSDSLAVAAAYGHHRNADGSGYPASCDEARQGMVTSLVKICDVFEALTATRPYKPSMAPAKAFRVMLDMKGQFDPVLLGHFVRTVGIYPAGTYVKLDDGTFGRVVRQTGEFHRPVVELTTDRGGAPLDLGLRRAIDLTSPSPGDPKLVVAAAPAPKDVIAL